MYCTPIAPYLFYDTVCAIKKIIEIYIFFIKFIYVRTCVFRSKSGNDSEVVSSKRAKDITTSSHTAEVVTRDSQEGKEKERKATEKLGDESDSRKEQITSGLSGLSAYTDSDSD